jgi:hypothetical protein
MDSFGFCKRCDMVNNRKENYTTLWVYIHILNHDDARDPRGGIM